MEHAAIGLWVRPRPRSASGRGSMRDRGLWRRANGAGGRRSANVGSCQGPSARTVLLGYALTVGRGERSRPYIPQVGEPPPLTERATRLEPCARRVALASTGAHRPPVVATHRSLANSTRCGRTTSGPLTPA